MNSHRLFWKEQPALLIALTILIGTSSYLFWPSPWNIVWPLLWMIYLAFHRFFAHILLLGASILYSFILYAGTPSKTEGYFSIASLQPHTTPFQKGLLYRGMLFSNGCRIPCSVYHQGENRPKANSDYVLYGQLFDRGSYEYAFKAKEWIPVPKTWSLAEFRYQTKETFRKFLENHLKKPRTATFLGSLITGDVEDRSLRYEFGKLGLQHILAISGFHFSILIAFCTFFLGLFLPHRWKIIALLIAINFYFLFIGSLPAVQRSWLTASLYLIGRLIGRHSSGLNLLGVAMTIELILDPLISGHIGFQLSFLSCAGILLLYPFFEKLFSKVVLSRSRTEKRELDFLSRHTHILATFFRQALSITCSVNAFILPLLLYYSHQFPILSLIYNLFFPFLVSAALFLLLLSLLLHLLFPIASPPLFYLTDFFTSQLLDLTAYPPLALDYTLKIPLLPAWLIPIYLFATVSYSLKRSYESHLFRDRI